MFNATVAGTSNHKFRSEKLKDTALDMRGDHDVNRKQVQQTNIETEQHNSCYKNYKTPLYVCIVMFIMLLIIFSIIYVALGGLQ